MNRRVLARMLMFAAACISLAEPCLLAAALHDRPRASGVWCERRSEYAITKEHEWRLALSLRRITGYTDLQFASDGSLSLGDSSAAIGGSAEARRILMTAVDSKSLFVIEDFSGSRSVTFGQAAPEQLYQARDRSTSQIWRLRLDFDDFQQMEAPSDVRASFDEGFTLFHELLHGLGHKDASRFRELGACEEIVNRVRSELGLPLRDQYLGETWRITETLRSIRLRFRSHPRNGDPSRRETRYLFFLLTESAECSDNVRALTIVGRNCRQQTHRD
jgi:hypothetical protein